MSSTLETLGGEGQGNGMTEQEWLASQNAGALLGHLAGHATPRKTRLALCGCLRSPAVWPLLTSESSRQAVAVSEAFADGATDTEELGRARKRANAASGRAWRKTRSHDVPALLATRACWQDPSLRDYGFPFLVGVLKDSRLDVPADLIRDLFGNPFRPASVQPSWLTPTVVSLAQAAYEDRALPAGTLDSARLGVLADALEDAGCTEAAILEHLRGPGPHVRGCHILDALLGKE
jgi:hypothetical protein